MGKYVVIFAGTLWATLLGTGFGMLYLEDATAAMPATAPTTLPSSSGTVTGSGKALLVI